MEDWNRSVEQKNQMRWWGQHRVAAVGGVGREGCRSSRCLPHGSSYSSRPEVHKYGQTHLDLQKHKEWHNYIYFIPSKYKKEEKQGVWHMQLEEVSTAFEMIS